MSFSPLFYDFKRTIRSKTVIIISTVLVITSLIFMSLFYSFSFSLPIIRDLNEMHVLIKENGNYSFYVFVYNQFGDPLQNVEVNLKITKPGSSEIIFYLTNYTDSKGIVKFKFDTKEIPLYISFNVTKGSNSVGASFLFNTNVNIYSTSSIAFVLDSNNPSTLNVIAFYVDRGEQKPNYDVYYRYYASNLTGPFTGPSSTEQNQEKPWEPLGKLDDYYKLFKVGIKIPSGNVRLNLEAQFKDQEGNIKWTTETSLTIFASQTIDPVELTQSFTVGYFAMFVSLMSILAAYNLYGKDKILGILDYVISNPITRLGLALSRYISMILALSFAIFLNYLLINLYTIYLTGKLIPWNILLIVTFALIVEAAAFLGIILTFSHIMKSTGTLLGIGIILFLVFSFFWNTIVFAISSALGINLGSADFIRLNIILSHFNPSQYPSLFYVYILGRTSLFGGFTVNISPEEYGLSLINLIILGTAWSIIPLVIFLYLVIKRD